MRSRHLLDVLHQSWVCPFCAAGPWSLKLWYCGLHAILWPRISSAWNEFCRGSVAGTLSNYGELGSALTSIDTSAGMTCEGQIWLTCIFGLEEHQNRILPSWLPVTNTSSWTGCHAAQFKGAWLPVKVLNSLIVLVSQICTNIILGSVGSTCSVGGGGGGGGV